MRIINTLNGKAKAPLFLFSPTTEEGTVNWTAFVSAEFHGITSQFDFVGVYGQCRAEFNQAGARKQSHCLGAGRPIERLHCCLGRRSTPRQLEQGFGTIPVRRFRQHGAAWIGTESEQFLVPRAEAGQRAWTRQPQRRNETPDRFG